MLAEAKLSEVVYCAQRGAEVDLVAFIQDGDLIEALVSISFVFLSIETQDTLTS